MTAIAPLKVYVAASSEEIATARAAMRDLEHAGVMVTSTWPDVIASQSEANPRNASREDRRQWSVTDLAQVEEADVLWFMAPSRASGRGAYVELGYAYARGKVVIASGDTTQSIFGALAAREFALHDHAHLAILLLAKERLRG